MYTKSLLQIMVIIRGYGGAIYPPVLLILASVRQCFRIKRKQRKIQIWEKATFRIVELDTVYLYITSE